MVLPKAEPSITSATCLAIVDGDKKEFLADVSSFANAGGGDLVFGMEEAGGLPTNLIGLASGDLDFEIRRLDSILAAGLIPGIRYGMRIVVPAIGTSHWCFVSHVAGSARTGWCFRDTTSFMAETRRASIR
jgi:hypothetical protein